MNFFDFQDEARKKTKVLILYFVVAVLLIILAVNAAVYAVLFNKEIREYGVHVDLRLQQTLWMYISAGVLVVISFGSLLKLYLLRHGGRSVAEMVNARPILPDTQDFNEKRLIHVVEEMAIASGVKMPILYVMDNEQALNAFVAGTKPTDTVLVVTKGLLEALNRDELQGVIGHEFSHIFNGDMQINVRLIGILAGILAIGQVGRFLLRSSAGGRRVRSKNNGAQGGVALIAVALFLIGYIGLFFGALIKSAISRQREFLADASAVQYTRNPNGIAGALIKIKGHVQTSHLKSIHAEDISHMCFGESLRYFISLFNTHPPIDIRIKRIDTDGTLESEYLIERDQESDSENDASVNQRIKKSVDPISGLMVGLVAVAGASAQMTAQTVSASVGQVAEDAVKQAEVLYAQIPEKILDLAHNSSQVMILLIAFLMPKDESWHIQAKHLIEQKMGGAQWLAIQDLMPEIEKLDRAFYLPIVEISIPALLQNNDVTLDSLILMLETMSRLDNKITPFEFAMVHLIQHRAKPKPPKGPYSKFDSVLAEIAILLTFVLAASKMPMIEQEACFATVFSRFSKRTTYLARENLKPALVDDAISKLNGLVPKLKQELIEAIAQCVIHDGKIEIEESELLRTIAASLDCPIPPLVV
jgi:Zn-dependent protease with chaperone function/septum formation topological specificity factor MinE